MCLIIDKGVCWRMYAPKTNPEAVPVIEWLFGPSGNLVYGGANAAELMEHPQVVVILAKLRQAGKAVRLSDEKVDAEAKRIKDAHSPRTNDVSILAIAKLSGARTLWTADADLMNDFRNTTIVPSPRGSVYGKIEHRELLCHRPGCSRWRAEKKGGGRRR